MAITSVGTAKFTPTGSTTSRTVTLPATIQTGDTVFVQLVCASGAVANIPTLSGVTGLTEIGAAGGQTFSGHRHQVFVKESAASTDAGAVLTVATAAALRVTVQVSVYRGAALSNVIDSAAGVNGAAGNATTVTDPTLTTTSGASVEIHFAGASYNATNTVNITSLSVSTSGLVKATDSYDIGTPGGMTHAAIYHNLSTVLPLGSNPGGDLWTVSPYGTLLSAFTVALKAAVSASSVRPNNTVTSAGWTTSTGTSFSALLADESDTTYAETVDNPNGTQPLLQEYPELAAGNITVSTRMQATAAAPLVSVTVALLQGATVIGSRTTTLNTAPTDFSWTTTAAETAAITDRTQLRTRITPAVQ